MPTVDSSGYRVVFPFVSVGFSWSHSARLKSAPPSSLVSN